MSKFPKFSALLAAAVVLAASCTSVATDPRDFVEAPFYGMIYDGQNASVDRALVILDGELQTYSDINGRFQFAAVSKGEHEITVLKDGYETKRMSFSYLSRAEIMYIKMYSQHDYIEQTIQFIRAQRLDRANESLEQALQIDARDPRAQYALAMLRTLEERYLEAYTVLVALRGRGIRSQAITSLIEDIVEHAPTVIEEYVYEQRQTVAPAPILPPVQEDPEQEGVDLH